MLQLALERCDHMEYVCDLLDACRWIVISGGRCPDVFKIEDEHYFLTELGWRLKDFVLIVSAGRFSTIVDGN